MNETEYGIRSISVNEMQQLLELNAGPVFLILYQDDLDTTARENDVKENHREQMLAQYLHRLGIPAHIKGYECIKRGVEIAMEDPSVLCSITKELYPRIARCCGSSSVSVERAIRHAIETAWNRGCIQLQSDLFGTTVNSLKGRPTNGEFIAMVAEQLRLQKI